MKGVDLRITVKHNNIFGFVGCLYQDVSIPSRPWSCKKQTCVMQLDLQTVNLDSVILKSCYLFCKILAPNGRTLPELPSLNRFVSMSAFFFLQIRDLSLQIWGRETKLFWSSLNHSQRTGLDQCIWIWNLAYVRAVACVCMCMYVFIFIHCRNPDVWFNLFIFMHCMTLFAVHKSSEWWAENLFRH